MLTFLQAFIKMQGFCQPASSFVPNVSAGHCDANQDADMTMPDLEMPLLPSPAQNPAAMVKAEWSAPNACYEAGVLLGGPVNPSGAMNREARVLRYCLPLSFIYSRS